MILALNVGNTFIYMGAYVENKLLFTATLSIAANQTKYELAVSIKNIFSLYKYETDEIKNCIISSAAPFLTPLLLESLQLLCDETPLVVGPGIKTGLNIVIDDPAQLGSDIVATSVAATSKYTRPIIIINFGTAIVMSAINAKGQHLGGAIIPGMELSFNALSNRAAQLPHIRIQKPDRTIGSNTIECMQSGIFYGTVSMLDGMIKRFESELKESCSVVITGDMAKEIYPVMSSKTIYDPTLVLDGLFLLYCRNTK